MATKKSWVSFTSATPVPAEILGEKEDRRMMIGTPVQLPADYAAHMIADRFAVAVDAPAPMKSVTKAARKASAAGSATGKAQASLIPDPGGVVLSVADAQAAYGVIQSEMETLTEDQPRWQALQADLDDAATALAQAQDAARS
ncbi:hypothetical protein [Pseudooceanicola sp. HF7]|uniref:hypothetical protein n=1 Tax=Pseudooceanicola sp. HF7 TaxID=2721560 RepID=UPI0014305065|nr:hypothetical protein [Pseudooceanicola sp. HF7]NIZ11082.1 hypothetical protein [Pseudooceanicola sp. HF7]